jgi:hypothetical protein
MDGTLPRPVGTDRRLPERWQPLADTLYISQAVFLCIIGED